ncbi:MAG TPA: hypothetical protein VFH51_06955, partial [Myxococcota bacterium]|nr:hypothetical protein [Myxococcota bacterium]
PLRWWRARTPFGLQAALLVSAPLLGLLLLLLCRLTWRYLTNPIHQSCPPKPSGRYQRAVAWP